jgi:hypothetical protein
VTKAQGAKGGPLSRFVIFSGRQDTAGSFGALAAHSALKPRGLGSIPRPGSAQDPGSAYFFWFIAWVIASPRATVPISVLSIIWISLDSFPSAIGPPIRISQRITRTTRCA